MEQIHQVVSDFVCTFYFQNNFLDKEYPWSIIPEATGFVVKIMNHAVLQSTSGNLFFRCDIILNTAFISGWMILVDNQ